MYAAGYGIRPLKSSRRGFRLALMMRDMFVLAALAAVGGGLATVALPR